MKPIAIFLTDSHLKDNNQELVYDIFLQAVKLAKQLKVRRVFHGGDFFTSRTAQSLQVLVSFYDDILGLFQKEGIELVGIPGNHDKTNQDSERSYLDIFRHRKCFTLFREEACIEVEGITFGFLPFFTHSYTERLKKVKDIAKGFNNDINILITHHAFNGAVNNDGSIVDDSIKPKAAKFWDKVLVGHYHDSNQFDNIYYTGSCYQSNFGERLDDKGFHIIYDNGETEFRSSQYPKYRKIKLDINDDIESEIDFYANKGDNVRFVFSGEKTDIHKINRQQLDEAGIDVKFELNDVNEEILKVESGDFSAMSKKNIVTYFKEYCDIQSIDKGKYSTGLKHLIK